MVDHKSPRPNLQNYDLSNGFFSYMPTKMFLQNYDSSKGFQEGILSGLWQNKTEHFLPALKIFLHNYSLQKCNLHIYAIFFRTMTYQSMSRKKKTNTNHAVIFLL